ncbi:hypothetical protein RYX36_003309 [Vicia faba]
MASLPLLLLLILCGSLHAYTPRHLTKKDTTKHHFDKVDPAQQQKIVNNEINIFAGCSSASTLKKVINERGHARSMMGPARHHVEETMVTNTNENAEDIVEMDYAQPHRKPPIHNEKP